MKTKNRSTIRPHVLKDRYFILALILFGTGALILILHSIFTNESIDIGPLIPPIAGSLMVIGTLSALQRLITEDQLNKSVREEIGDLKKSIELVHISQPAAGQIKVHEKFPKNLFFDWLAKAKEKVWILQTYLPESYQVAKEFTPLLCSSVNIRILMSQPMGDMVKAREYQLEKEAGFFNRKLLHDLSLFKDAIDTIKRDVNVPDNCLKNLKISLYDSAFSFAMYRVDNKFLIGWYWKQHEMTDGVVLEMDTTSIYANYFLRHFEEVWKDSEKTKPYF